MSVPEAGLQPWPVLGCSPGQLVVRRNLTQWVLAKRFMRDVGASSLLFTQKYKLEGAQCPGEYTRSLPAALA